MLAQAVEHLIKNIVDFPDDVSVKSHENSRGELLRVRVNPEDIGRVIGRNGRTANAIRTVVQALRSSADDSHLRPDEALAHYPSLSAMQAMGTDPDELLRRLGVTR